MAARTLEELNQLVDKQQKVIQMLKDVHEIQNLMGKYVYWHEVERDPVFPDTIYAMKTPGVSAEVAAMGAYVGADSIRRFFEPMPGSDPSFRKSRKGSLFTHPLATPVIEVAGDGNTAKGIWMSPGYEGGAEMGGGFCYTKYGVDFAKEDGKWKVWHYHVYRVFMTPWNVPYTDEWEKNVKSQMKMPEGAMGGMEARKPDLPPTVDNPYSKDTCRELAPEPPEPYETWADTWSYGPPEK